MFKSRVNHSHKNREIIHSFILQEGFLSKGYGVSKTRVYIICEEEASPRAKVQDPVIISVPL